MKKLSLLLVLTLLVSFTGMAQNSLIATLSHEGNVQMFYGSKALVNAHAAAVTGDVITLSSGTFEACNITKAIKILGAGMAATAQGANTILNGQFTIDIADANNICTFEGIWSNSFIYYYQGNIEIIKSAFFGDLHLYNSEKFHQMRVIQSKTGQVTFINCPTALASFFNSDVAIRTGSNSGQYATTMSSGIELTNCVLRTGSTYQIRNIKPLSLYNCIISSNYDNNVNALDASCNVLNCIAVGPGANYMFKNISNQTNTVVNGGFEDVFKTFRGTWVESETYELTDEAAATYLGSDGMQVGIYGGLLPFDPVPSNPQITKCNVANKSSLDGKLSVDIEVSVAK